MFILAPVCWACNIPEDPNPDEDWLVFTFKCFLCKNRFM